MTERYYSRRANKPAKAAGVQIVIEVKDEDYGGRGFTCRDLEGDISTLETYDPW